MNIHLELFIREIKRIYSRYGTKENFEALFNNIEQPKEIKELVKVLKVETVVGVIRSTTNFQDISPEDFVKKIKIFQAENMIIPFLKRVSHNFNDPIKFGKFLKAEIKERMFNDEKLRTIYSYIKSMPSKTLGEIVIEKLAATENNSSEEKFLDEVLILLEKQAA